MQDDKKGITVKVNTSFRYLENAHILFWLIKDTCWSMGWRTGGMTMIAPTLGMAIFIVWKSRHSRPDLFHNIAICLWIAANTLWMTGEFYKIEKELRPFVLTCFTTGLSILAVYYTFFFAADRKKEKEKDVTIP